MLIVLMAVVAIVAVLAAVWYRAKANALLDDELALTSYHIGMLFDDEDRNRQRDAIWNYIAVFPSDSAGAMVAASSIRVIALAKQKFGHPEGRRNIAAMMVSIHGALPRGEVS
jgi:hypothetical protein